MICTFWSWDLLWKCEQTQCNVDTILQSNPVSSISVFYVGITLYSMKREKKGKQYKKGEPACDKQMNVLCISSQFS